MCVYCSMSVVQQPISDSIYLIFPIPLSLENVGPNGELSPVESFGRWRNIGAFDDRSSRLDNMVLLCGTNAHLLWPRCREIQKRAFVFLVPSKRIYSDAIVYSHS
jgi:hypothetical protein